jgi:hypothetical protein
MTIDWLYIDSFQPREITFLVLQPDLGVGCGSEGPFHGVSMYFVWAGVDGVSNQELT